VADFAAIRAELASRLDALLGNDGQASAYWQTNPTPPTLQVVGIEASYDSTFGRGGDLLTATIEGLAGSTADRAAQEQIDAWLDTTGSTSVKEAIETERPAAVTLGGLVDSCRVVSHTRPLIVDVNTTGGTFQVWSVEFTLEIRT
jgi:hypothetical protein